MKRRARNVGAETNVAGDSLSTSGDGDTRGGLISNDPAGLQTTIPGSRDDDFPVSDIPWVGDGILDSEQQRLRVSSDLDQMNESDNHIRKLVERLITEGWNGGVEKERRNMLSSPPRSDKDDTRGGLISNDPADSEMAMPQGRSDEISRDDINTMTADGTNSVLSSEMEQGLEGKRDVDG